MGSFIFEDFHRIDQKIDNIKVKDFYRTDTKPFILKSFNTIPVLLACSDF
jgi:hypothetical protein